MPSVVLDTNVPIVANKQTPQADIDCVLRCINKLAEIRVSHCLLIDSGRLIIEQYRRHLSPGGQPGPGGAFFKWLWDNQGNPQHCRDIAVTPAADGSFAEFPPDPALARFDRDDRVFVAVALASGESPPIINAADTDWRDFEEAFLAYGIKIIFLCPELMGRER